MPGPIRLLIADDDRLLRETLTRSLQDHPQFKVVGAAGDGKEAVDLVIRFEPDLVLMDIAMPRLDGFGAARRISVIKPRTRVLFMSGFLQDCYIEQVLNTDAWGYIVKGEGFDTTLTAIRDVVAGRCYYSEQVKSRIVIEKNGVKLAPVARSRFATLTPRQIEAVRLLANGLSYKEIATRMGIEWKTVDNHITAAMRKLDIHDKGKLMIYAIGEGLVHPAALAWRG